EHRLAEELASALHRVQPDRQRLGERELAQRDVAADRIALALAHHEILGEHALHVRVQARAAEELHVRAELLAPGPATFAAPAGVRWRDRDVVPLAYARDIRPDRLDDGRRLVPGDQRLANDEAAVAAFEVV